jgi:hypothetical protein
MGKARLMREFWEQEEKLGNHIGPASLSYCQIHEEHAAELLRCLPDAAQCSGQRVLPDND